MTATAERRSSFYQSRKVVNNPLFLLSPSFLTFFTVSEYSENRSLTVSWLVFPALLQVDKEELEEEEDLTSISKI